LLNELLQGAEECGLYDVFSVGPAARDASGNANQLRVFRVEQKRKYTS
jgi:hypothetical protein